jgi:hypothetical protein
VNPWAIANSGGTGFYAYGSPRAVYINSDQSTDRSSNLFPDIKAMCVLRLVDTGSGFATTNGVVVGMDRDYWTLNRGWQGEVMFCSLFAEPLPEDQRGQLLNYLFGLAGLAV